MDCYKELMLIINSYKYKITILFALGLRNKGNKVISCPLDPEKHYEY